MYSCLNKVVRICIRENMAAAFLKVAGKLKANKLNVLYKKLRFGNINVLRGGGVLYKYMFTVQGYVYTL